MKNEPVVIHQSCHPQVSHKCHPRVSLSGISTLFSSSPLEGEGGTQCRVRGKSFIFTARFVTPQCRYAGYSGHSAFTLGRHAELVSASSRSIKGFTLIELLVVVLIIGILSTLAVSQYKKAVVKSKNANLKHMIAAIVQAQKGFYLENGRFAAGFNELPLDVPFPSMYISGNKWTQRCGIGVYSASGVPAKGKDDGYYLILGTTSQGDLQTMKVIGLYGVSDEFKCAGFEFDMTHPLQQLVCREPKNTTTFPHKAGRFCQTIENATLDSTLSSQDSSNRIYTLP